MTLDERLSTTQGFLEDLLRRAGTQDYSARDAQRDAQDCWREIRADNAAHGKSEDEAFFEFVVVEDRVGIFTFFEGAVGIYVVEGNEQTFRTQFEPLAMAEIAAAKALLATRFAKQVPDLIIAPPLSSAWLGVDTDES